MKRRWSPAVVIACAALTISVRAPAQSSFVRGDADGNTHHELTDGIAVLGFLFLGVPSDLPCLDAADADDNGSLELSDPIQILGFLFLGGPPPPAPFPSCGVDPTDDALPCTTYDLCAPPPVPPAPPLVDPPASPTRSRLVELTGRAGPDLMVSFTNPPAVFTTHADASGLFRRRVDLRENYVNRIYAVAIDKNGTSSAPVLVSVIEDETPPALHVDEPVDGSATTAESVVVAGRVADMLSGFLGLSVTVAGEPAQVIAGIGTNGTFERSGVPLQVGRNSIEVAASDAAGNTAQVTIAVTRTAVPEGSARLVKVSGDGQRGRIHEALPLPIVVRALRGDGSPWPRKLIAFEVTRSDGRLAGGSGPPLPIPPAKLQVRTDDQGLAAVTWTLGGDAGCGNNRLTARGDCLPDVLRFCASAAPGPAAQINVGTGDMLRAEAGGPAPEPLRAWVSDGCNGIGGVAVTFRVTKGGGRVNGASEATVTTSSTGHAEVDLVLGPAGGNNAVEATFDGNLHAPAVFRLYGVERRQGQPTTFAGIVEDNSNQPIGGAVCSLFLPGQEPIETVTAADGRFLFDDIPGSGASLLRIEGSPATRVGGESGKDVPPGSFPFLVFMTTVVPTAENSLPGPVLLPPLDPANRVVYDGTQDVVLDMAGVEGIRMKVKAGSMRLPDGTLPTPAKPAFLSLDQVHHDDVPMPMPDGAAPQLAWTLQPGLSTFDPPVEVAYPNLSGLPAGAIANFLTFNHDTHRFEIVSSGHVTAGGATIVSDPGSGIPLAGWGANCPPYSVRGRAKSCRVISLVPEPQRAVSPWELVSIKANTDPPGRPVTFYGDLKGATTVQATGGDEIGVVFNSVGAKEVHGRCGTQKSGPRVVVHVVEISSVDLVPDPLRQWYCKGEQVEYKVTLSEPIAGVPVDIDLFSIDPPNVLVDSRAAVTDGSGAASVLFVAKDPKGAYVQAKLKGQPKPSLGNPFGTIEFEKGKAEIKWDSEDESIFSDDPQGFCETMKIDGRYTNPDAANLKGLSIGWEFVKVGAVDLLGSTGAEFKAQGPFTPGKWQLFFYCDVDKNQSRDPGEPVVSVDFEVRPMKTVPLTVARHSSIAFSDGDATVTLDVTSDIMQRKNTHADERCCVELVLAGTVTSFNGPSTISNQADWNAVSAVPAYAKLVDKILFCDRAGDILGCANVGGPNMVMDQRAVGQPSVWAHEWGHTRGLDHAPDGTSHRIMYPYALGTFDANNTLFPSECQVLEAP